MEIRSSRWPLAYGGLLTSRVAYATDASSASPSIPNSSPSTRSSGVRDGIYRRTIIDAEARAVVYRDTDVGTGELLQQFPNEAILKLRTYVREQTVHNSNAFNKKA